ncbi:MAG: thiolase domain-containing protein [Candidatus Heimdallarchaeaceae archaeon]
MRRVAITGVGLTKFGNLGDITTRELFYESSSNALKDAGLSFNDIDAIYFGNLDSSRFEHQCHTAAINASIATNRLIPATRVEDACASGGVAVAQGFLSIAAGIYDTVLVVGAEKMTNLPTGDVTDVLATCADDILEVPHGITFPGLYALMARAHMNTYGTTEEQLAMVAVKNHKNALDNPYAQFHKDITIEKVLSSLMVADPLKIYDCSPISDGGAAIVLTTLEKAQQIGNNTPVEIVGVGQASDTVDLASRKSLTSIQASKVAAERAYKMANIKPSDIDVAEVHDCFTIAEIINTEDLGFFNPGEGGYAVETGLTKRDGDVPVNPSGGLKAKGHPIGASGVAQIVELTHQIRGTAGKRQVSGVRYGLAHNMGGSGATAVVHILKEVN